MALSDEAETVSASDLIRNGIVHFAAAPPMNFQHLDFPRYTLPLIEHDYPAKTAAMWNSAYAAFGMAAANVMLVGNADRASVILDALRQDPRYLGGGAGVGFKQKVVDLLDERDALVDLVGSVNFVSKTEDGKLRGHNTDGVGYAVALEDVLRGRGECLPGKRVLMLGAGGTACAVAFALAERGVRLHIVNRTADKAAALASRVNAVYRDGCATASGDVDMDRLAATADIVVNVSTIGSAGVLAEYVALGPVDLPATPDSLRRNRDQAMLILDRIPRSAILSDVVIADGGTPLLRSARGRGFQVLDGVPMVINQAVEAFWTLHGQELSPQQVCKGDVARTMRKAAVALKPAGI